MGDVFAWIFLKTNGAQPYKYERCSCLFRPYSLRQIQMIRWPTMSQNYGKSTKQKLYEMPEIGHVLMQWGIDKAIKFNKFQTISTYFHLNIYDALFETKGIEVIYLYFDTNFIIVFTPLFHGSF